MVQKVIEKEKSIRKQWLISSIIMYGFSPLVLLLVMSSMLSEGLVLTTQGFIKSVVGPLLCIVNLFLLYVFAYKKRGIKLITFFLCVAPFRIITTIISLKQHTLDIVTIIGHVFDVSLFVWWYVSSLRLRKVNKFHKDMENFTVWQ